MTNGKNRTLSFQIDEELFQRIKAHLDRESARLGQKVTQRGFVLNAIIGVLNMAEPMDVDEAGVGPCEVHPEGGTQPRRRTIPPRWARNRPYEGTTTKQQTREALRASQPGMFWGLLFVSPEKEVIRITKQDFAADFRFTDEEMETAKGTDLPDLLEYLGYTVRRLGNRYHTTREMDSLRIKDRRTWKRYSNGKGGDAITFLQKFCGKDFREAVNYSKRQKQSHLQFQGIMIYF